MMPKNCIWFYKIKIFVIYKKDTPHSELLFKIVLNQKTSASGHKMRPQNIESIMTVNATNAIPAGITIFINLKDKNIS